MPWTTVCWGTPQSWLRQQGSTRSAWSCRRSPQAGSPKRLNRRHRPSPTEAPRRQLLSEPATTEEQLATTGPGATPATTASPSRAAETPGPPSALASPSDGPPQGWSSRRRRRPCTNTCLIQQQQQLWPWRWCVGSSWRRPAQPEHSPPVIPPQRPTCWGHVTWSG